MKVRVELFPETNYQLTGVVPAKWYVVTESGRTIKSTGYSTRVGAEHYAKVCGWKIQT